MTNNPIEIKNYILYNTYKKVSDFMKLMPIGIESFKTMIDKNAYYVDKTNLIQDVLNEQVVLYTRPRRFGKTLNMSMLYYFFSIKEKENAYLFDGLNISKNKEALKHQNKYPTLFITLKDMKNSSYEKQMNRFKEVICLCAKSHLELLNSERLLASEKKLFQKYVDNETEDNELEKSLFNISYFLINIIIKKSLSLLMNMMFLYNLLIKIIIMMKW